MSKLTDKLVTPGEKPQLSPNPDGSGYVAQYEVDSLPLSNIKTNALYILKDGRQFKYDPVHDTWLRVENGPSQVNVDGGRGTPVHENQAPKLRPQVFSNPVAFNDDVSYKGKSLDELLGGEGGAADDANVYHFNECDILTDEIWNKVKSGDVIVVASDPFLVKKNNDVLIGIYIEVDAEETTETQFTFAWEKEEELEIEVTTTNDIVNQGIESGEVELQFIPDVKCIVNNDLCTLIFNKCIPSTCIFESEEGDLKISNIVEALIAGTSLSFEGAYFTDNNISIDESTESTNGLEIVLYIDEGHDFPMLKLKSYHGYIIPYLKPNE